MALKTKPARRKVSQDIFDLIGRSESIREASRAMQAMAHPLRLKILCLVGGQELSVLEIVEAVGTTQSNVSQHLGVLRDQGLLESRKQANKVYYRIGNPRVLKMISLTRELFCSA
jgi:ArsR family transcriptional regulator